MSTLAIDVTVRAMISILVLVGRSYRKRINGSDNHVVGKVDNMIHPIRRPMCKRGCYAPILAHGTYENSEVCLSGRNYDFRSIRQGYNAPTRKYSHSSESVMFVS